MSQILISVIIPVYNGEKFIARAIESVLKQTLPAFEIIVINDGSKDGTEKILEQYAGKIIYKTIPNGGVSNARNVGIEMSGGDWIAFLDADDIWYPNKLERQSVFLQKFPKVGLCCSNFAIGNLGENHFSGYHQDIQGSFDTPLQDSLSFLIQENFVGTASNVIVKRAVLQKAGRFNAAYRQAEDYDLWLRCALHTDFLFMSEVLLDKDTHENNLTNNQLETCQCHDRVLRALVKEQRQLLEERRLIGAVGAALAAKSYQMGNILYDRGERRNAFARYWQALTYSWTFNNVCSFIWVIVKKTTRTLTGGLISRKNFKKANTQKT